jgi:hypothetical protein
VSLRPAEGEPARGTGNETGRVADKARVVDMSMG